MNIERAVVLVTGANRGLGLALVREALKSGASKVYAAARDPGQLEKLVREAPAKIVPIALDVTSDASLASAAGAATDVSLLVNNAGVLASYDVLTSSNADIAQDFAVNAFGMLAVTKAFVPALERAAAAGGAAVVNVLSVVSLANMPALGSYSSSKAAAFSMTQALRSRLAEKRIRVHAALPGAIDTDMVRSFDMPKTSPEVVARGIFDGVARGADDISPDPMSEELLALWKRDPKELERRLAAMAG